MYEMYLVVELDIITVNFYYDMTKKYSQLLIIRNDHWLDNPGQWKITDHTKGTVTTVMKWKNKLLISLMHHLIVFNT